MHRRSFVFSLLLFPILNWWITPPKPQEVRIAVSGNLKEVLTEVGHYVETRNPMTKVKLFFGSAEEVARQVENQAEFDLYIGDEDDMSELKEKSLLIENSGLPLFSNQIVAVANDDVDWDITEAKQLTPDNVKRIALQKDTTKPGKRAREYLQKYGVLDAVKDKITDVKTPKAALEAVKSGEAKWTLAYSTDAVRRKFLKVLWRVPAEDLPPIVFSAARPITSKNPDISARAMAAMQSSIVRRFFENAGYLALTPPPDNREPKKK